MKTLPANLRCPYCSGKYSETKEELSGECPACGIRHHLVCWSANYGCTTLSCEYSPKEHGTKNTKLLEVQLYLSEEKLQAEQKVIDAIRSNSDIEISKVWKHHKNQLVNYQLAEDIISRIHLAENRQVVLDEIRQALDREDHSTVARAYLHNLKMLKDCIDIKDEEKTAINEVINKELKDFKDSYSIAELENDDEKISFLAEKYDYFLTDETFISKMEKQRVFLAENRTKTFKNLKAALRSSIDDALDVYEKNHDLINSNPSFLRTGLYKIIFEAMKSNYKEKFYKAIDSDDLQALVGLFKKNLQIGEKISKDDQLRILDTRLIHTSLEELNKSMSMGNETRAASIWKAKGQSIKRYLDSSKKERLNKLIMNNNNIARLRLVAMGGDLINVSSTYNKLISKSTLNESEILELEKQKLNYRNFQKILSAYDSSDINLAVQIADTLPPEWLKLLSPSVRQEIFITKKRNVFEKEMKHLWENESYSEFISKYKDAFTAGLVTSSDVTKKYQIALRKHIGINLEKELEI